MSSFNTNRSTSLKALIWMALLVLGMSAPALAKEKDNDREKKNNDQPFAEILAHIRILNGKLDDLKGKGGHLPGGLGPCEVPPVWGKTYATADRFVSVLGGAAFCDKATGLVWDGSPDTTIQADWPGAVHLCTQRTVGGVHGFHLPMIEQLTSLLPLLATDLNSATGDGPFSNVQPAFYWSATTLVGDPAEAWGVTFGNGDVFASIKHEAFAPAWCVRGGQAYDGQQQ